MRDLKRCPPALGLADLGELAFGRQEAFVGLNGAPEDFPDNPGRSSMLFAAGREVFSRAG